MFKEDELLYDLYYRHNIFGVILTLFNVAEFKIISLVESFF